jgi:hypothetical protein
MGKHGLDNVETERYDLEGVNQDKEDSSFIRKKKMGTCTVEM